MYVQIKKLKSSNSGVIATSLINKNNSVKQGRAKNRLNLTNFSSRLSDSSCNAQSVLQLAHKLQLQAMIGGKLPAVTVDVEIKGSAEKHVGSTLQSIKMALVQALAREGTGTEDQGDGVHRFKINDGKGYIVYRRDGTDVEVFHYHWNYNLDLPLTVDS